MLIICFTQFCAPKNWNSNTGIMFKTFEDKENVIANVNSRDFLFKMFIKIYVDNISYYKSACPICRDFEKVVYKHTNTQMQNSVGFCFTSVFYIWCFEVKLLLQSIVQQDLMETTLYPEVNCGFLNTTVYLLKAGF